MVLPPFLSEYLRSWSGSQSVRRSIEELFSRWGFLNSFSLQDLHDLIAKRSVRSFLLHLNAGYPRMRPRGLRLNACARVSSSSICPNLLCGWCVYWCTQVCLLCKYSSSNAMRKSMSIGACAFYRMQSVLHFFSGRCADRLKDLEGRTNLRDDVLGRARAPKPAAVSRSVVTPGVVPIRKLNVKLNEIK